MVLRLIELSQLDGESSQKASALSSTEKISGVSQLLTTATTLPYSNKPVRFTMHSQILFSTVASALAAAALSKRLCPRPEAGRLREGLMSSA